VTRAESHDLDVQIGAALREARLNQGITQEELAQVLGVNRTTIARYESGRRGLSIAMLLALTRVLDVLLSDLVPGLPNGVSAGSPVTLAPAEQQAVATLVRVLGEHPDLVPTVLETVETLLNQAESRDGAS
jgi:transcriptional regulator with XRE-family HTH domain